MWPMRWSASSTDAHPLPETRSPSSSPSHVKCDSFACRTRIWFPVELTLHSDEAELAVSVGAHLYESGPHEFDRVEVPEVHLDNSPGSEQTAFHTKNVLLACVGAITFTT